MNTDWFAARTWHSPAWTVAELAAYKGSRTVSVVLPALDEQDQQVEFFQRCDCAPIDLDRRLTRGPAVCQSRAMDSVHQGPSD